MSTGTNQIRESEAVAHHAPLSPLVELLLAVGVSALLLIPCVWLDHIEAGDLSSHQYNAWLAGEIRSGAAPGLALVPVWTNTLGDFALEALPRAVGAVWTERVVVSASVLIFFWGLFSLVATATGRRPWMLAPSIGMLSYGLIFHLGFLNFYLSTGLCLWVMILLWRRPSLLQAAGAGVLLVLAALAHALPVAWAAAVLVYLHLARRWKGMLRLALPFAALAALGVFAGVLTDRFPHRWSLDGIVSLGGLAGITGVEQVWLFGGRYMLVAAGLLLIWLTMLLERIDQGEFLSDPVVQVWLLHLVAFVILPSAIQFPQYQHLLAYIPQRISLLAAVFLCVTLGQGVHGRGVTRLSVLAASVYFTFLYVDDRAFNRLEREITDLVHELPPGQRVVAAIADSDTRLNATLHVVDRACIGHCFSYGDYEPATGQFRIRVVGPNPVVAPNMTVVQDIENGEHVVTPAEAPLYSVCLNDKPNGKRFILRALHAGERNCAFSLPISPRL